MEVVSAEVNSLLPEEIMDTEIALGDDDSIEAVTVASPVGESIPMETELEEIVDVNQTNDSSTISTTAEPVAMTRNHASQVTAIATGSKPESSTSVATAFQGGLHKLSVQMPVSLSANQIILNKVPQPSDLKPGSPVVKQEGQKLIVTTLGKSGHPIVLTLPQSQLPLTQKATALTQPGDTKLPSQQIKVVTIGGRSEVKPVIGVSTLTPGSQLISTAAKSSVLQTQQLKTVQIAKKTPASSSGPMITKLIIAKPINSKAVTTGQTTAVSSVLTGGISGQILQLSTENIHSEITCMCFMYLLFRNSIFIVNCHKLVLKMSCSPDGWDADLPVIGCQVVFL